MKNLFKVLSLTVLLSMGFTGMAQEVIFSCLEAHLNIINLKGIKTPDNGPFTGRLVRYDQLGKGKILRIVNDRLESGDVFSIILGDVNGRGKVSILRNNSAVFYEGDEVKFNGAGHITTNPDLKVRDGRKCLFLFSAWHESNEKIDKDNDCLVFEFLEKK